MVGMVITRVESSPPVVPPSGDHRLHLKNSIRFGITHMLEWYFTALKSPLIAHN